MPHAVKREFIPKSDGFKVVLATPIHDFGDDFYRRPLYERVADAITGLGARVFLPHRDIGRDRPITRVYHHIHDFVIPSCDLVLADIGADRHGYGSSEVRAMIQTAANKFVYKDGAARVAYFWEGKKRTLNPHPTDSQINYDTAEELIEWAGSLGRALERNPTGF